MNCAPPYSPQEVNKIQRLFVVLDGDRAPPCGDLLVLALPCKKEWLQSIANNNRLFSLCV